MCICLRNVEYVKYVQKPFLKNVSFCGNVEYVEYVDCFWSLQAPFEHPNCLEGTRHWTLQLKEYSPNCVYFLRKCWICWICSKAFLKTRIDSFCGNVECWILWMLLELTDPFWTPQLLGRDPTFNITAERVFSKMFIFCGDVEYVEYLQKLVSKNVLLSGEMLNILNMFLELAGLIQKGYVSSKSIQHIQHVQQFPRRKHIFENIPRTHSTYLTFQKTHFWKKVLLTAVMLNVGFSGLQLEGSVSSKNIFNIFNIFYSWKKHIVREHSKNAFNVFNISAERSTFLKKCASHSCSVECFFFFSGLHLEGSVSSKNSQHNQHIQHYIWKKHIFRGHSKNTVNIFNISAARSTCSSHSCNVECWVFGVCLEWSVSSKTVNIINIFNSTFERSTIFGNTPKHIQHIQHFSRKNNFLVLCLIRRYFRSFGAICQRKGSGLQK